MGELTTIKELETPIKLTRFLYFYDLLFIVGYAFVTYELLVNHVYSNIQIIYMINCLCWGIYFILPAFGNSQRKNWQNVINTLINMYTGKTYYEVTKEADESDIR